jgi:hypothetical protein
MIAEPSRVINWTAYLQSLLDIDTSTGYRFICSQFPLHWNNVLIWNCVGSGVFTVVVMKNIIFWDMTPWSALSCTRSSSETSGTTQCTTRRHIPEDDTLQYEINSSRLNVNIMKYSNEILLLKIRSQLQKSKFGINASHVENINVNSYFY